MLITAPTRKPRQRGPKTTWDEAKREAIILTIVDEGLTFTGIAKRLGLREDQVRGQLPVLATSYSELRRFSRQGKSGGQVWEILNERRFGPKQPVLELAAKPAYNRDELHAAAILFADALLAALKGGDNE